MRTVDTQCRVVQLGKTFLETGMFGDGSDGAVTFDGSSTVLGLVPSSSTYTLNRSIFCSAITINSGVTIKTAGYKIFCTATLLVNSTGIITNAGANASNASGSSGSSGAAAVAAGELGGSAAGGAGANGSGGVGATGTNGTSISVSMGASGGNAGAGGGNPSNGGAAGTGGAISSQPPESPPPRSPHRS